MSLLSQTLDTVERLPLPDVVTEAGIDWLVGQTRRRIKATPPPSSADFAREMQDWPIALHTDAANTQHYEVPERFFGLVLGPRRKYSCAYYTSGAKDLATAEIEALKLTCEHADLKDRQSILELGCGWGSLSLFMAETLPEAHITSVSNSHSQRAYIEAEAARRGLGNLSVITADMNDFNTDIRHDRIVSVEMFEHMSNWRALLTKARTWLKPEGFLFLHVFTHMTHPYRFDHTDPADWIGKYFFTGGIMPSQDLPGQFADLFHLDEQWRWSGTHYQKTARDWVANFDRHEADIMPILTGVYGKDARLWKRRWRLFFLATAGLFGHARGDEWGVGHYRLSPA